MWMPRVGSIQRGLLSLAVVVASVVGIGAEMPDGEKRPRVRELGIEIGVLPTGTFNAITDVAGVRVGQATVIQGDDVRTGVTAILPHAGNIFQEKVPGAVFVGNGFGKLMGSTQVQELGEIETPILLTNTLAVPRVADALLDWVLEAPGNEQVRSINPLVAETNDGFLNDIRGRHVGKTEVFAALRAAQEGPIAEGSVGAGTGTVAFGFKGGIGTSSRVVPDMAGGYTVGVLVQSNFGGILTIDGAPVGKELGQHFLKEQLERQHDEKEAAAADRGDGSIIIVVATDAPLDARNLERLAGRTMLGLARTGSAATNGSGDYAIAFSTAIENRIKPGAQIRQSSTLANDAMSPLFLAVIEATEEAICNSLFCATSVTGRDGNRVEALPIERTLEILRRHGAVENRR